jgi:hypothetical protein
MHPVTAAPSAIIHTTGAHRDLVIANPSAGATARTAGTVTMSIEEIIVAALVI